MANDKWYAFTAMSAEERIEYVKAKRDEGYLERDFYQEFEVTNDTWVKWKRANRLWKCGHGRKAPEKKKDTLCWECQNATGGCSWSKNLTPVKGWETIETAEPTWIGTVRKIVPCVTVTGCPEYVRG